MKLTHQQANELLGKVYKARREHPSYRLGQGIFNLLPKDIADSIYGNSKDFYHLEDEAKVLEVFYAECVED